MLRSYNPRKNKVRPKNSVIPKLNEENKALCTVSAIQLGFPSIQRRKCDV